MIVVIDYDIGNTGSVVNALNKLGLSNKISGDPTMLRKAKALILPGVGNARQGMENLKKRGLDKVIIKEIKKGKPLLGICLGMQLLFERSEEGNVACLGVYRGIVKKFRKEKKIPQIGWNSVKINDANIEAKKLLNRIPDKSYFYFVNSFYCLPEDKSIIAGESNYGELFASIVIKEKVVGVQFHPEKSGKIGFTLLKDFIKNYVN